MPLPRTVGPLPAALIYKDDEASLLVSLELWVVQLAWRSAPSPLSSAGRPDNYAESYSTPSVRGHWPRRTIKPTPSLNSVVRDQDKPVGVYSHMSPIPDSQHCSGSCPDHPCGGKIVGTWSQIPHPRASLSSHDLHLHLIAIAGARAPSDSDTSKPPQLYLIAP